MKRKQIIWLASAVLLAALALTLWWPVIFQRGNPIPYLLAISQLSEERPYVLVGGDALQEYITKDTSCPELIAMIEETRQVTFEEQTGPYWVFRAKTGGDSFPVGTDRLMVTTETYWRD